jgi:flagellar hook-length control protein FliK
MEQQFRIRQKGGTTLDVTQIGYAGPVTKKTDVKTAAADAVQSSKSAMFSDFLSTAGSAENMASKTSDGKDYMPQDADSGKQDAYDRYQYRDNTVDPAKETDVSGQVEELAEETKQLASDAVTAISQDLGVDEDDVVNAMEALGFTVFDLQSAQNLAELVKTLNGVEDDAQILLNADFGKALADVSELIASFAGENGMELSELSEFAKEFGDQQTDAVQTVAGQTDAEPMTAAAGQTEAEPVDAGHTDDQIPEQQKTVSVEDRRTPQQQEEPTEENAGTQTDEAVNAETVGARTDEKDSGKDDSPSSGKQESQDLSQSLAAALNEQPAEVAEAGSVTDIPEYTTVDAQDIIDQIVEQTKVILDTDTTTIEMQLNPENLGRILFSITSREGAVSAQLYAQNEAVSAALEAQIATLVENLNQAGVRVDAIEVSVAAHEFERNLEQNAKDDGEQERHEEGKKSARRSLRLDSLDDLSGLMTEEETLVARMMKENGNSVDFTA